MDDRRVTERVSPGETVRDGRRTPLPHVTNDERDFWRRAVENERARQRCVRPAPFPFQPA